MKKILSLLLALCLILTPAHAFAEGTCTQMQISDISLATGDLENPITLGMSLLMTMLSGDKGASVSLTVNDAQNNTLAAGGVSMDTDGLTYLISGMQTAFHLSYESLATLYTKQTGISPDELDPLFTNPIPDNQEDLPNPFTASAERLIDIYTEVFRETEQTPNGVETVSVFDAEYKLQRVDLTISSESLQKICFALLDEMSTLATNYPEQFSIDQETLAQLHDNLAYAAETDVPMRLWHSEDGSVTRVEADMYTASHELITTILSESLNTETDGDNWQISFIEPGDGSVNPAFYFGKGPSKDIQFVLYDYLLDINGDIENTLELSFGCGTYEDSDTLYMVLSGANDLGTTELGCNYIYQDLSQDSVTQYGGYVILWCDTYDEWMVQTDSLNFSFALDFIHGSYDTDGTLSTQGITSIVEIDQMSEADIQQAEAELNGVLQNFIMAAASDPGVQQLLMLFQTLGSLPTQ